MSLAETPGRLHLPESLRNQLDAFRGRVWAIKAIEAVGSAAFGLLVAFLILFAIDRLVDTPRPIRLVLFVAAAAGFAYLPWALYRWIWRNRRADQLARLLTKTRPRVGDRLLGVIELVQSDTEQARSRALCEAAVNQVADEAKGWDLRQAVPNPRHKLITWLVAVPGVVALALLAICPAAATNAFARLAAPWKPIPRYTFAAIAPLPDHLVVPHGEPFAIAANLEDQTAWKPARGEARIGGQPPIAATLVDGRYTFELPAQIDAGSVDLRIGDYQQTVRVEPTLRPELNSIVADITLPGYLQRPGDQRKDIRGGNVTLVKGSTAAFTAVASRDLAGASVDGQTGSPAGAAISSPKATVDASKKLVFRWEDTLGLAGREPFTLSINARDDEAPSVTAEELPRQRVVLDSEVLNFKVHAQDDFGVKTVGIEWQGRDDATVAIPAHGEQILAGGGADKENLDLSGTFSAKSLGIEPQPIEVRVFVEDFKPGRERVYSTSHILYILNAEQHAIWLTEQLSKWHRQSLEVRDREMQLFETNKQLRAMNDEELARPENIKRLEAQASAERSNEKRLSALTNSGEDLVRQAMRNPEIGVGHLEKWAEMLGILNDIAANRMPTVADLLKQASQQTAQAQANKNKTGPMAGMARGGQGNGQSPPPAGNTPPKPAAPMLVDSETTQQPLDPQDPNAKAKPSKGKAPRLTLPKTTVAASPKKKDGQEEEETPPAADENLDEAVTQQQDLLAEFEKIADEMNKILANLEGSTLVKRLKAASRMQYRIAGRVADQATEAFGQAEARLKDTPRKVLDEMADQEAKSSQDVSVIMDDMQAYFERRRFQRFKTVLDEMKEQDVIGSLRTLGDELKRENGVSIALAEFWSDTLDRWGDNLVDPACSGTCPGGKSKNSLPPSIVLEVLQILEGEINLRDQTRVAQQAKGGIAAEEHKDRSSALSQTQDGLRDRVDKVIARILELPEAEEHFGYELNLLGQVVPVMQDATGILAKPETGDTAIAAETEAIELLLKSKKINPKGGGGGGPTPGGGGTGKTMDSALALIGRGQNDKEVREDHGIAQSGGESGPTLPEEFRAGLDEYFNRLERAPGTR